MQSAFMDRTHAPAAREVEDVLGAAWGPWSDLHARIAEAYVPLEPRWTCYAKAYGWSLQLRHKKRGVIYLTPQAGRFRAGLLLSPAACTEALDLPLGKTVKDVIREAPTYPEGRAIRLVVTTARHVEDVMRLVALRMRPRRRASGRAATVSVR